MEEITDFIQLARDLGLYVILRPGPYICAEWDRGGLPEWLLKYKPANFRPVGPGGQGGFLRSADPAILQWDKHWYDAVAKIVKPHLVTNLSPGTPGVILWQLENEYDLSDIPPAEQAVVLQKLAEFALADGIDVPLFGCRTAQSNANDFLRAHMVDSSTCYPGYDMAWLVKRIGDIARPQTEKFRAIPELQGGWFSQVGGKLSEDQGYNAAQLNQVGLVAIEQGCTLVNYFVFHGGSQFGYGAAQNLIQSYDYDAPIREWGGVGDRYLAAKAIGLMLQEHGARLARATTDGTTIVQNVTHPDVHITTRKLPDSTRYIFVRTDSKTEPRKGTATITFNTKDGPFELPLAYDLPAFGAKVLYLPAGEKDPAKGEWLPKPVAAPARPDVSSLAAVPVQFGATFPDTMLNWKPVKMGQPFAALGINDTRYVEFRSHFTLSPAQLASPPTLLARVDSGNLLFRINGKLVNPDTTGAGLVRLAGLVQAGDNTVEILFENNGYIHYSAALDLDKCVPELSLLPAGAPALSDWRMKTVPVKFTGTRPEIAADLDDSAWQKTSVTAGPNIANEATAAVFRSSLDLTADQLAAGITLTIGVLDDTGDVYINGTLAGGNTTERSQHFSRDITRFLKPGHNVIAVVVTNTDQVGGLFGGAYVVPKGQPLDNVECAMGSQGVQNKAWERMPPGALAFTFDASTTSSTLPGQDLVRWFQMTFNSPQPVPGTWVPWHLHLEASVNGQLYFNGHHMGAYWAAGPQRDFYLPECWLMPAGQPNVIALQARPTSLTQPLFKLAEVRPYKAFAEKR